MCAEMQSSSVFSIAATVCGNLSLIFGIISTASDQWLIGDASVAYDLWFQCDKIRNPNHTIFLSIEEKSSLLQDDPSQGWLQATRAFIVLCVIFTFFADIVNFSSQCLYDKSYRYLSAWIFLCAGTFGFIAASIFTGKIETFFECSDQHSYGYSYFLAWTAVFLNFAACALNAQSAQLMVERGVDTTKFLNEF